MILSQPARAFVIVAAAMSVILCTPSAPAQAPQSLPSSSDKYPGLPSEIPANFKPVTSTFDYEKREVMIPMRDGVKLHTVILIPKGAEERSHSPDPHALQR